MEKTLKLLVDKQRLNQIRGSNVYYICYAPSVGWDNRYCPDPHFVHNIYTDWGQKKEHTCDMARGLSPVRVKHTYGWSLALPWSR